MGVRPQGRGVALHDAARLSRARSRACSAAPASPSPRRRTTTRAIRCRCIATTPSTSRPTWRGIPRAIRTSATATSTRASARPMRVASGWRAGVRSATARVSSTRRTASPSAPKDEVFVADRGNRRIQVFDPSGKFLRQFTIDVPVPIDRARSSTAKPRRMLKTGSQAPGAPDALCMTPGPNPVLFVGDLYPSRIYKVSLEGKLLGVYGGPGRNLGEFGWIHAIACPVRERDLGRRADQLARPEARDQEQRAAHRLTLIRPRHAMAEPAARHRACRAAPCLRLSNAIQR